MATSSQIVFEERNTNASLGQTIRFVVPPSVGMINTQQTYLKFNMVVGTKGKVALPNGTEAAIDKWFPWTMGQGGAANLIRNLTIRSNGVTLEQITDYNRLNRILVNYTKNPTQRNMDKLYKGSDSQKVKRVNTLTRRSVTAGQSEANFTQENMEVEVCLPLELSGILNNSQPYPNMVAPLEIEILLENEAYNVVTAQGAQLGGEAANFEDEKDVQNTVGGYRNNTITYKVDGTIAGNQTSLDLLITNDGNNNLYQSVENDTVANLPFYNGQECVVECSQGNVSLVINTVQKDAATGRLQLNFNSVDFGGNTTANPFIYIKIPTSLPTITLSELQLVVGTVNMTPQQLSGIESAVRSGNGYGYVYKSFADYPVNMSSGALQTSNLINSRLRHCKAILSFWENTGAVKTVEKENLLCEINSNVLPTSYQFKMDGLLVPNREVPLDRFQRTRNLQGAYGSVALKELEQGLACCGYRLNDYSNADGCFLLARGLVTADSAFTYDMSKDEETRLNLKFSAQSQSLLNHNFICHIKELQIGKGGLQVVE